MQNKHLLSAFDVVAFVIFLVLALVVWSFIRAANLVQPQPIELEASWPVSAAEPTPLANPADLPPSRQQELERRLDRAVTDFIDSQPNHFGIYLKHLPSGVVAGADSSDQFISASLYKPFAVAEVLKQVDDGQLALGMVTAAQGRSLKQCIWDTITVSDNPCGHAVLNLSGLAGPGGRQALARQGYKQTDLSSLYPVTSAADTARLMQNILDGKGLSAASHRLLLDALLAQKVNNRWSVDQLKAGRLAHKTGDLEGYVHDAGIVLRQSGNYVIAVLSGPDQSGRQLSQRYAAFGRLLKDIDKIMFNYGLEIAGESS